MNGASEKKPCSAREASWREILRHTPEGEPIKADACQGQSYWGLILAVTPHYVLQACNGRAVVHERSLLATTVPETGRLMDIRYACEKDSIAEV